MKGEIKMFNLKELEEKRFDEMKDFGYTWFGMYPLKTLEELNEAVKGGYLIYELRSDNTESALYLEESLEDNWNIEESLEDSWKQAEEGNVMLAIDIMDMLCEKYQKEAKEIDKAKSEKTFNEMLNYIQTVKDLLED